MKKNPFENLVLDEYEQEIEDNLGSGDPLPPEESERLIAMLRQAAFNSYQTSMFDLTNIF